MQILVCGSISHVHPTAWKVCSLTRYGRPVWWAQCVRYSEVSLCEVIIWCIWNKLGSALTDAFHAYISSSVTLQVVFRAVCCNAIWTGRNQGCVMLLLTANQCRVLIYFMKMFGEINKQPGNEWERKLLVKYRACSTHVVVSVWNWASATLLYLLVQWVAKQQNLMLA